VSERARLLELLDKEDIRAVVLKYCRGVDRRDRELLESLFVETEAGDGTAVSKGKALADQLAVLPADDPPGTHLVTNQLVDVAGDAATCESYFVSISEVRVDGTPCTRTRGGRYLSRLHRTDAGWKLVDHIIVDDWDRQDEITSRVSGVGAVRGSIAPDDPLYGFTPREGR
jgi:hypothetical protein